MWYWKFCRSMRFSCVFVALDLTKLVNYRRLSGSVFFVERSECATFAELHELITRSAGKCPRNLKGRNTRQPMAENNFILCTKIFLLCTTFILGSLCSERLYFAFGADGWTTYLLTYASYISYILFRAGYENSGPNFDSMVTKLLITIKFNQCSAPLNFKWTSIRRHWFGRSEHGKWKTKRLRLITSWEKIFLRNCMSLTKWNLK